MATINYLKEGPDTSFSVVFIHGFCESKEIWSHYLPALSVNNHIIAVDLPGFGASPQDEKNSTIDSYAEQVVVLLKELNIKKIILIGHSLGGYVALSIAAQYPELIHGLVLFHSSAFEDSLEKKENRNKTIDFVFKNGSKAFASTLIPTLFTPENKIRLEGHVNNMTSIAANTKPESITAALVAMRDRPDRTEVLKNIQQPVLFIVGKEDKAVPLEASLKQCHLPKESVAYFLAETAHMGMFEKEKECLEIIKDFISLCSRSN